MYLTMALEAEQAQDQSAAPAFVSAAPIYSQRNSNVDEEQQPENENSNTTSPLETSHPAQARGATTSWNDDEQLTDWADESEELEALAAQRPSALWTTEAPIPPESDEGYESAVEENNNNSNNDDEVEYRRELPLPVAALRRGDELSGRIIPFYIPETPFRGSTVRTPSPLRTKTLVGGQSTVSETAEEAEAAAIRFQIAGRHLPPPKSARKRKSKPYDASAFAQSQQAPAESADRETESEHVRPPKRRESKPYDSSAFAQSRETLAETADMQTESDYIRPPKRRESKAYDPSAFTELQEVEAEAADTDKQSEHTPPPKRRESKAYRPSIFTEEFELEQSRSPLLDVEIKRAAPRAAKRKARSPAPFAIPTHRDFVRPLTRTVVKKFRVHMQKMQGRCSRTRKHCGEVCGNVWLHGCWSEQVQNFGYDPMSFP
jgi:hypothetical protein